MKSDPQIFDYEYYRSGCGDLPYLRSTPEWHSFFRPVADAIVLGLAPRKVFDAGCAVGFLVEMLWDRGVEAHGRDISEFAISQVRADIRPWCAVGSIADPIEGQYDLILCIEVLEHMPADEALAAIGNMAKAAPRILFSSSPTDLEEATHINVRPTRYWLERFAEAGFAPVVTFDATFLCPHAVLFERTEAGRDDRSLAGFAEIVRQRLKLAEARNEAAKDRAGLQQKIDAARQAQVQLRAQAEERNAATRQAEDQLRAGLEQLVAAQRELASARRGEAMLRMELQKLNAARQETEAARQAEEQLRLELDAQRVTENTLREQANCATEAANTERAGKQAETARANIAESRLRFMENSRGWRVASMLQRMAARMPLARRAARVLWWTVTMQLRRRLRLRREQMAVIAEIRGTGLFDDTYYLAHNPDLAMSGMDLALHFAAHGWQEGRKPGASFDPAFYLARYPDVAAGGMNPLLHYVQYGRAEGRQPLPENADDFMPPSAAAAGPNSAATVASMVRTHNAAWAPLPVFADHQSAPTLTILTDSVDPDHLFGGVATAMVVGTFAASRIGARLRLVTRNAAPDPAALGNILQAHRVDWDGPADFLHMPSGEQKPLSLGDEDLILTTSWWTTRATLGSVNPARILYLLQEDERMFYPFGDSRLRCAETLSEPELRILVNTRQLFEHLAEGPDRLPRLHERANWFQPAFPSFPRPKAVQWPRKGRQNFFFYARPNNDRNLYWRGLEVINTAMREGVLEPDAWDFHFVGRALPDMELPGGVRPSVWARLPWAGYAELVSRMDLGLCLMDTPHPSYPPLDLAASGAVVVTNTHGAKTSLEDWSSNIIAAPPSVPALVDALREGVALSRDTGRRFANCASDHIPRDWNAQLRPVIAQLLPGKG